MATDDAAAAPSSLRGRLPALLLPSGDVPNGAPSPANADAHQMRMPVSPSPRLPPRPHAVPSADKADKARSTPSGASSKQRHGSRHAHSSGPSADAESQSRRRSGSHHHHHHHHHKEKIPGRTKRGVTVVPSTEPTGRRSAAPAVVTPAQLLALP
eukprot:TRINITY_DN4259_c0_g1_i6.p3 TRINITY_DN4259_c0_g1~~TRINITY_DN4259_c0_g1_i6.p3  ORF type:complete len:155 (+),score=14.05 TRINITY_DN4259_c0_g1_i6:696-1160(+)